MIQEIKIKNFLSFKNEVTFSFEATPDTFSEDYQVVKMENGVRLLRLAIIYGYNASGKTNLLKAIDYVCSFCFAQHSDVDESTGVIPFMMDNEMKNAPSHFELVFYVKGTKYVYVLELDSKQVFYEKLSCYKSVQPTMLFERFLEDGRTIINFNPKADKIVNAAREQITINCLNNVSVFVARSKVNVSLPLIDDAREWLLNHTMPMIFPSTKLTRYAQKRTTEDSAIAERVLGFLQDADFNITDFQSEESSVGTENDNKEKETVKRMLFGHTVEHGDNREVYYMNQENESIGTIRAFGIETAILSAQSRDAFLPIDELETSLHPKLQEKILYDYLKEHTHSQLLVTTHNDGLLDLTDDLIRKDSIWFTEKGKEAVTDLFRLTDFRGLNRLSSIREAYRNKRFGATMSK